MGMGRSSHTGHASDVTGTLRKWATRYVAAALNSRLVEIIFARGEIHKCESDQSAALVSQYYQYHLGNPICNTMRAVLNYKHYEVNVFLLTG